MDVSQKIGDFTHQNGWFIMENPIKHGMIWGYHDFWKHPNILTVTVSIYKRVILVIHC